MLRNNALADRLRDRELEVEEDEKDKLRERDEVEKSTSRSEEEEEMDAGGDQQWAREAQPPATQLYAKNFESDEKKEVEGEGEPQLLVQQKPIPLLKEEPPPVINAAFHSEYHLAEEDSKPKVAFEIGGRAPTGSGESSSGGGVKRIASGVFGTDEEQEEGPKKKPLTRPSAVEEQAAPPPVVKEYSAEERKKVMKTLVDSIPTSKGDLFAYQIKWDFLDSVSREAHEMYVCMCVCLRVCVRVCMPTVGFSLHNLCKFPNTCLLSYARPTGVDRKENRPVDQQEDNGVHWGRGACSYGVHHQQCAGVGWGGAGGGEWVASALTLWDLLIVPCHIT